MEVLLRGYDEGFAGPSFGLVVVDSAFRSQRLGSLLVRLGEHVARERSASSIRLTVYGQNEAMCRVMAGAKGWDLTGCEGGKAVWGKQLTGCGEGCTLDS